PALAPGAAGGRAAGDAGAARRRGAARSRRGGAPARLLAARRGRGGGPRARRGVRAGGGGGARAGPGGLAPRVRTMSAFGPYARTEVVDFRPLDGRDLVLIEGPTGAGKTAILDAMTFALFGVVPGARDLVRAELKSAWADPAARCEVRLD